MRPNVFQVGGILYWVIQTRNPDTMVLKDADSTPTVVVRKNGASVGDSVTITKRSATTGIYDCSYNPASEVEGDSFTLEESATVTGTTTSSATYTQSWNARVIAVERGTDGANTTAPDNASVTSIKAKTDNLPSDPADASDIASSFSTVNTKLDTIDDFLDTEIAAIKAKTDNLPSDPADQSLVEAAITAATSPLATPAQVNAQVLDVLSVDTFAELAAPPAATSSLKDKITWLFMWLRNKGVATAAQRELYADNGTTIVSTETITDDGTTFTKGKAS